MSAIETKQVWSNISRDNLDSKYEKCRNITEEIYKRINITFQIKKLETGIQSDSDQSDIIDSNELSNETDLFACDKSSISSSTEAEGREKCVNINNNELREKKPVASKRPKKRFRKRVKKRQQVDRSDSDASSDSALPLSRMVTVDASPGDPRDVMGVPNIVIVTKASSDSALPLSRMVTVDASPGDPRDVMGVPNIVIVTKDLKPRIKTPDKKPSKQDTGNTAETSKPATDKTKTIDKAAMSDAKEKGAELDLKSCTMCSLSFRGERGLRRHMNMTHVIPEDKYASKGTRV